MGWFVHRWGREQTGMLRRWEGAAGFGKALGSAVGVFVMLWFCLPLSVNMDQDAGKTEG